MARERIDDIDSDQEALPYKYTITAYGADFPVDGIVQRLTSGDIAIPTFDPEFSARAGKGKGRIQGFQRDFVWTKAQMDKFIESLLLGLPVPGIFLVREATDKLLVLDGQQRLRTLKAFYEGQHDGKPFKLDDDVQRRYRGKTYEKLADDDRRRIDNSIIHATVVRQDRPSNDQGSIYLIFERLNTGGTKLRPQQIRVALYRGAFVDLLRELNDVAEWRRLYGPRSSTLKDHELILRFFALLHRSARYGRPMKEFLNSYMASNKDLERQSATSLRAAFVGTVKVLSPMGRSAFRLEGALNAAVFDSVMVGVALRLRKGPIKNRTKLKSAYKALVRKRSYLAAVTRATADEESVRTRLRLARIAFARLR